jgi:hypothetical protein
MQRWDVWHGTPLTDDIATLISTNVLVSLLIIKRLILIQPMKSVPCHLVNASYPYPSIWVLLCSDGLLVLLPMEVLERWDCPGGKWQLVLQKDLSSLSIFSFESYPTLGWFLFQIVVYYLLHLSPLLQSYFTFIFSSKVILFLALGKGKGGSCPSLCPFKTTTHIYFPISIL